MHGTFSNKPLFNDSEFNQPRTMDEIESWCSLSPLPVVRNSQNQESKKCQLDIFATVSAVCEAVQNGAFGDAELVQDDWHDNTDATLAIRNRVTGEVEFLLIIRNGEIEYFRRCR